MNKNNVKIPQLPEWLKIRLDSFNMFNLLVEQKNFSKVAIQLGKTQGTISQQLKELERILGNINLIKRDSKKFEITPIGKKVYNYSKKLIEDFESFVKHLDSIKKIKKILITIAASSIPGEYFLPPIFGDFRQIHPEIKFHLSITNSYQALQSLQLKEVKFAAIGKIPKKLRAQISEQYDTVKIGEDEIQIIAREDHPIFKKYIDMKNIASREKLIQELLEYPWIFREEGSATREHFLENFKHQDQIKIGLELENNIAIVNAIEHSRAFSALSSQVTPNYCENHRIKQVFPEIIPPIKREFYLLKHKSEKLSNEEQEFWKFVEKKIK